MRGLGQERGCSSQKRGVICAPCSAMAKRAVGGVQNTELDSPESSPENRQEEISPLKIREIPGKHKKRCCSFEGDKELACG